MLIMNYLCAAIKKEVVTRETFYSREEGLKYFQQKFGERIAEKMEENERRLENKILYLKRKLKKYEAEPEIKQRLTERKQVMEKKWGAVERWLNGEDEQNAVYIEEKYEQFKERLVTEDEELFFYMGGIYKFGNRYTVTEEKYYYICQVVTCTGGCPEVMERLPEKMTKNNCSLYICKESPEAVKRYTKQIAKIRAQVRREYFKNRALMRNTGIFTDL